ncbi:unnamed protein product [Cuscuta campestris]|uniref:Uncharacterized protein n=1 Tax=Cuscuta campestris TaxID=132261 RepID=A0A484KSX3_9ASTE|nr:unnamed protein product [Cuscuta campestris]
MTLPDLSAKEPDASRKDRNSQKRTKVPSSILKSSYSILLRVAASHWLATTHTNTVTKAMGMLLYKIKNDVSVNLAREGFAKDDADKDEPLEPLFQIDYRHFEGNHFNDIETVQSHFKSGVSALLQYLDSKLQANKEELSVMNCKKVALEEENRHLTWLKEMVTDNATAEDGYSQGKSSHWEEDDDLSA